MKKEITNINYAARISVIKTITKHPNADKLFLTTINGDTAITNADYKEGDVVVKFPLECTINKDFLRKENAFEETILNEDTEKKGYFNKHGRVRAIKLRGVFCGCYIHPIKEFNDFFGTSFTAEDEGLEFNKLNDISVAEKYVPNSNKTKGTNLGTKKERRSNIDLIKDGQFRFHWDTSHFGRNLHKIEANDVISVTNKIHGTSVIVSHILTNRKLSIVEKIAKFLGANIKEHEYGIIAASRKVIKSVSNESLHTHGHYYGEDIWQLASESIKDKVDKGITLYGEIVGYTPSGSFIQKGYDYGFVKNEGDGATSFNGKCIPCWDEGRHYGIFIYRITYTTPDGNVIEFDWNMIKEYCLNKGLKHVEEIYHGKAKDFIENCEENEVSEKIFAKIKQDIEKKCYLCTTGVPMEGYVIRRESRGVDPFKVKSEAFLLYEGKELDSGEVSLEDEN